MAPSDHDQVDPCLAGYAMPLHTGGNEFLPFGEGVGERAGLVVPVGFFDGIDPSADP
jgi:hypothetical protein